MAITYAAPTEGATAVAALSATTLVASFSDGEGRARNFIPVNTPVAGTTAASVFPAIVSVSQVTDSAGGSTGPVALHLKPGTSDFVNDTSAMTYLLDQDVTVVTVSGTF